MQKKIDDQISFNLNFVFLILISSPFYFIYAQKNFQEVIDLEKSKLSSENKNSMNIIKPSQIKSSRVIYDLREIDKGNGMSIPVGNTVYFEVPLNNQMKPVEIIVIAHRQESKVVPNKSDGLGTNPQVRDPTPGLASVQIFDKTTKQWVHWRGENGYSSGPLGAKFSEPRISNNPEYENLYQWQVNGYIPINDKNSIFKEPLYPLAIRVQSIGKEEIYFHYLELKSTPHKPVDLEGIVTTNFSSSVNFGDYSSGVGLHASQYLYRENALKLDPDQAKGTHPNLPKNWEVKNGELQISFPASEIKLYSVEMILSDIKEQGRGGAFLDVFIRNERGELKEQMMKDENVPSKGSIRATPDGEFVTVGSGETLVIKSHRKDFTNIGAVRLGYELKK